jgi:hypothetical protein
MRMGHLGTWALPGILILASSCMPSIQRVTAPRSFGVEGGWNDWIGGIGLLDFGNTLDRDQEILRQADFCGEMYELKEIAWPLIHQVPPDKGPYYGIFPRDDSTHPKASWKAFLISNGSMMTFAATYVLGGQAVQWFPLVGHPAVLENVRGQEGVGGRLFADLYWTNERQLRRFLESPHTEHELVCFLDDLKAQALPDLIICETSPQPYMLFRTRAAEKSFITCSTFEGRLHWDKILPIWLSTMDYAYFTPGGAARTLQSPYALLDPGPKEAEWHLNCLANVYLDKGAIVGVLFRESSFPGLQLTVTPQCEICDWYHDSSLHYWIVPVPTAEQN